MPDATPQSSNTDSADSTVAGPGRVRWRRCQTSLTRSSCTLIISLLETALRR
ncbi:hypothetical protein K431DRAFT_46906 [Polychaeton citri CBS 116435]|uniref:Uncharacterized protein n=1 Tax=Polychaeton citri CBS 116435 TaxID=1314669 RepID=A0A9P4QA14_9PEZI|nr:hypothetical protein K431DRAFT_46906 [Polychaeton citri CBS 116435]